MNVNAFECTNIFGFGWSVTSVSCCSVDIYDAICVYVIIHQCIYNKYVLFSYIFYGKEGKKRKIIAIRLIILLRVNIALGTISTDIMEWLKMANRLYGNCVLLGRDCALHISIEYTSAVS